MSKSVRSILALLMVIMLTAVSLPVTAYADSVISVSDYNAAVQEKEIALEKKYGVRIEYAQNKSGYAAIGTPTLTTLDMSLGYITPGVVRQISDYLLEKNGKPLTFVYTGNPEFDGDAVAAFAPEKSEIVIFVPKGTTRSYISTGSGPLYIVHEFGHAFHDFLASAVGAKTLQRRWTALNGGIAYGRGGAGSVFVTDYAASAYNEDFADTFGYALVCNRAGLSIANRLTDASGNYTALAGKVEFIKDMLAKYVTGSEEIIENLNKCYTAPRNMSYRGLTFSGSALQYIGFHEPIGTVKAVMAAMPFEVSGYTWQKEVGGWLTVSTGGKEYIVFPGAVYAAL